MGVFQPITTSVIRASTSTTALATEDAVLVSVVISNADAAAKGVTFADDSGTRLVLTQSPVSCSGEVDVDVFMAGGLTVTPADADLDVIVKWRLAVAA